MITWQVGEPHSLIDCQKVNIRLSLDSGYLQCTCGIEHRQRRPIHLVYSTWFSKSACPLMTNRRHYFALSGVFELGSAIGTEEHVTHDAFRIPQSVGNGDQQPCNGAILRNGPDDQIRVDLCYGTGS